MTSWRDPTFASRWAAAVGSAEHPAGDDARVRIINPALLFVVRQWEDLARRGDYPKLVDPSILALSKMTQQGGQIGDYSHILPKVSGEPLNILDLGCGEGYLGRLLSKHRKIRYTGIDLSNPLLTAAQERGGDMEVVHGDLGDTAIDASQEHFVFLVLVLEHLVDVSALLTSLARSAKPTTVCVAVTLNGHAPGLRESKDLPFPGGAEQQWVAPMPWEGGRVEVTIRSETEYQRLFRDTGHVLHEVTSLVDPTAPQAPPTFTLWIFSPMGVPSKEDPSTTFAQNPPLMKIDEARRSLLASSSKVLRISPGAPILTPHMLGGCLFVVVSGVATAQLAPDRELNFLPGQVFGDLEAGWASWDEHYQLPVSAGLTKGCLLAVVAAAETRQLGDGGFHFSLFEMLQGRLRERLWLDPDAEKGRETSKASKIKSRQKRDCESEHAEWYLDLDLLVPTGAMVRMARRLLFAVYNERHRPLGPRSPDGLGVYIKSLRKNNDASAIRVMVKLGLVATVDARLAPNDDQVINFFEVLASRMGLPAETSKALIQQLERMTGFRKGEKERVRQMLCSRGAVEEVCERVVRALDLLNTEGGAYTLVLDFPALRALATSHGVQTRKLILARAPLFVRNLKRANKSWAVSTSLNDMQQYHLVQSLFFDSFATFVAADSGDSVLSPSLDK